MTSEISVGFNRKGCCSLLKEGTKKRIDASEPIVRHDATDSKTCEIQTEPLNYLAIWFTQD